MTIYRPDPDTICICGHFHGFGNANHKIGHRTYADDTSCMECDCSRFVEDTRATLANWAAEDATW